MEKVTNTLPPLGRDFPRAMEAEKGVLSAFLQAPEHIGGLCAAKGITHVHFFHPAHAIVFKQLHWHSLAERATFDAVMVMDMLRDQMLLDQVGGPALRHGIAKNVHADSGDGRRSHRLASGAVGTPRASQAREWIAQRAYDVHEPVAEAIEDAREKLLALAQVAQGKRSRLPAMCDISKMLGKNKPERPPELIGAQACFIEEAS